MSEHNNHDNAEVLSPQEAENKVWELAEDIGICMFTTWSGTEQHSRPLAATVRRDEHAIYFLVDESGHKNVEIDKFPEVSCAFVDKKSNDYVVIAGEAHLSNDREKIKDIWTDMAKAWWDSENDPSIRLLTVSPSRGEIWDGPNGFAAMAKMAFAAATGHEPDMGEMGKTRL